MNITNAAASVILLFMLSACQEKAQSIEEESIPEQSQQQYKQGKIDTHATE